MEKKIKKVWISKDNPSIQRTEEKCINCGQCQKTCWEKTGIKYDKRKVNEPICINCGQCILTCPTGALSTKYDYKKVLNYIYDTDKTVIISVAPATRVAIGEEFGFEAGSFLEGKMVAALKAIGFSYVFDVTFGADLTIIEEANEFVERLSSGKNLPQFTSCCPSWIKYIEIYHPDLISHLSTAKSPIAMQASIIRTYFRRLKDIDPGEIINVIVVPCAAKKYEIKRSEVQGIDFAITTLELAMMIRECNIDFSSLANESFDCILGKGSSAGLIFGASGGVMEASLRTVYSLLTGLKAPATILNFTALRGNKGLKEATININKKEIRIAVVDGLINFENILPKLKSYDFIEVMNCPGGCVGGSGQPIISVNKTESIIAQRINSLYKNGSTLEHQCSHNNPDILNVYRCFLGKPQNKTCQDLLHTSYSSKEDLFKKRKG